MSSAPQSGGGIERQAGQNILDCVLEAMERNYNLKCLPNVIHFAHWFLYSLSHCVIGVTTFILKIQKLKIKEFMSLIQVHTAVMWQIQDVYSRLCNSKSIYFSEVSS